MGLYQKIKKTIRRISNILQKDSGMENESTKFRYVLRVMLLLAIVFNVIGTITNVIFLQGNGAIVFALFFVLFILIFAFSYYSSNTKAVLVCAHLSMIVWVGVFIICFGWNSGIQALILALFVFGFFSTYGHYRIKTLYAIFLLAFRMVLFVISKDDNPIYAVPDEICVIEQFLNSVFTFFAVGFLCYVYSKDSQNIEGKLVEYNIQLVNQANTDPLTGLNNRRKTVDYLESITADSRIDSLCVAICDIDFFKKINDTYGHDIGDKVLKSLAQTMINSLGESCLISRWGGEEFLIVFPGVNGDIAYQMLQDLRTEVAKLLFEVKDRSFKITLTYGLAEYDFSSDIQTFIKEADKNLYYGKEHGRDQVVF